MTLGTFPVGAGQVLGVAFDGANIWVANQFSASVSKLRASDGMTLGTFTVGNNPSSVAFDGANIWVANQSDNTVSKVRATDGMTLGTFAVGAAPAGLAFDGANIWVSHFLGDTVSKLRASDGMTLGTFAGATIRRCVNSIGGEYPSGLIKPRAERPATEGVHTA